MRFLIRLFALFLPNKPYHNRMKIFTKAIILTLLLKGLVISVSAQSEPEKPNLRWYLSGDSSSYAGMVMVNQIWTRYIWNNPDVNETDQYSDIDLGIRRSRLIFYTYLMDKMFMYTQVGYDGQTYRSGKKPGITLFNAQTEYILSKNKLHLGFGLHTWNGVSRYNNVKLLEFLVVDNPGFAYPVGGTFDQAGRQFGMYAKGHLGKLHYRVSVVKPFETGADSISSPVTTERVNENFAVKGYFSWQFLDKDKTLFPYMTMNNLGRGRLLNVGAGFYYHPEAMLVEAEKDLSTVDPMLAGLLISTGNEELLEQFAQYGPSKISDVFLGAVDFFLDIPVRNNGAVTSYLGYYYYFFGPNYLRTMSKMNVSRMTARMSLPQGPGNSEFEVGTGHIVRGEWGYLLPGKFLKSRVQPYGAFTYKNFQALDEASVQYDFGANLLMRGHNIKWTLQYSTRPVYTEVEERMLVKEYLGQFILQTQLFF